jgi:transposase
MLAQLLRSDLVATVFVSSPQTRELKELLRHRTRLVRDAARMKHRIRMILAKNNLTVPFRDLFGIKGRKCLDRLSGPAHYRSQIETYAKMYDHLDQQIEPLTDRVKKEAKTHPIAQLLVTIPGIGPILAMTIIAEIEDIARFASYRNLSSYAGLVPGLHASGQMARCGKITKQGSPYLRWAMVEAAQAIGRVKRSRLNLFFRRRIVRSGYQKAITATAHKLLQIVFYVWKNQTPYQENYSG